MSDDDRTPSGYTRGELLSLIRSSGGCGEASPDGEKVCIKVPEHEGPHGWERPVVESAGDLKNVIYGLLFEELQGDGNQKPRAFVGLQGDKIVVMQPGGEHYAVLVLPAEVGA